jgi:hypothetical protein
LYAPNAVPIYADQADYVLREFTELVTLVESYSQKVELC